MEGLLMVAGGFCKLARGVSLVLTRVATGRTLVAPLAAGTRRPPAMASLPGPLPASLPPLPACTSCPRVYLPGPPHTPGPGQGERCLCPAAQHNSKKSLMKSTGPKSYDFERLEYKIFGNFSCRRSVLHICFTRFSLVIISG